MKNTNFICIVLLAIISSQIVLGDIVKLKDQATDPVFLNETYSTGYQKIEEKGDIYYWIINSRKNATEDPLVLWLTGGPGCSSEYAVLFENGPFFVNDNATLTINPHSWNNFANVLYIDQPIGTGFSDAKKYETTEQEIAEDFYTFFTEFLTAYPQYKGRKFFITGESYAGKYIPAISAYIVKQGNPHINFQGSAIGNGWVNPYYQFPQYNEFAYANGLISQDIYQGLKISFIACQKYIKSGKPIPSYDFCEKLSDVITGNPPRFNVYDISKPCIGPFCYDETAIHKFMKKPEVLKALGVEGKVWSDCTDAVTDALEGDEVISQADNVAFLLSKNVPMLIYSGELDYICNWMGGQEWTNNLNWPYQQQFANASYINNGDFGSFKTYKSLTFYKVAQAGHMVPHDQPAAALDMLWKFMTLGGMKAQEEESNKEAIVDKIVEKFLENVLE